MLTQILISKAEERKNIATSNVWLYEESFYIIKSDLDLREIKLNVEKMKKKVNSMRTNVPSMDLSMEETKRLRTAYGNELDGYLGTIEERINSILNMNMERTNRGLGDLFGELLDATKGVPGPTQYRQEIEAFAKMTSLINDMTSNQERINKEIDTITEIDKKQMKVTRVLSTEIKQLRWGEMYANELHIFRSNVLKVSRDIESLVQNAEKRVQAGKTGMICNELLTKEQLQKHTSEIKRKEKHVGSINSF